MLISTWQPAILVRRLFTFVETVKTFSSQVFQMFYFYDINSGWYYKYN
jgi:hypothetical protein